jgi:hypothetical protein
MMTNSMSNPGEPDMSLTSRRRGGGTFYLLLWLILAAGAVIYLAALALAPNAFMAFFGSPKSAMTEANEVAAVEVSPTAALESEIAGLKDQLQQVEGEVRTLVATNQSLTERLETIENASIQVPESDSSAVAVSQKSNASQPSSEDLGITGIVVGADNLAEDAGRSEPETTASTKKPKSAARMSDEGSTDKQAGAAEPAAAKAKQRFGLELFVSNSPEALQLQWDVLSERHGGLLKGLSARTQTLPSDPSNFRLVAGPFTSAQQAQSLCAKLKKQNVPCQVTGFGGDNI